MGNISACASRRYHPYSMEKSEEGLTAICQVRGVIPLGGKLDRACTTLIARSVRRDGTGKKI